MSHISEKNRASWNAYSDAYYQYALTDANLGRIVREPESAFDPTTWAMLREQLPSFEGLRVCVPSSGDNKAVLAFAALGAQVTSCDISEKQLENAEKAARRLGLSIDFLRTDTMTLDGVATGAYDFVYTSNGVHVWIADLAAMYRSIARILKPGALYALYEIHPFQRPFDGDCLTALKVIKPYDCTGPFETESEVTFAWRMQDILNAIMDAELRLRHIEELQPRVDYENPDWVPNETLVENKGHGYSREEIDRMYDWRVNPQAALPGLFTLIAAKA